VPSATLTQVLKLARRLWEGFALNDDPIDRSIRVFLVASRVDGLEPGIYEEAQGDLAPLAFGSVITDFTPVETAHEPPSMVLFSGDAAIACVDRGTHGYRRLLTTAAFRAHTTWLVAIASGLAGFLMGRPSHTTLSTIAGPPRRPGEIHIISLGLGIPEPNASW
jgi:hypothetical protein